MALLDMRTVILNYAITNPVCIVLMAILWFQNRKRFTGLGFWLADFVMQFLGILLLVARGVIPDILSMTVSNLLIVGGTVLLLIGLEKFMGMPARQVHNFILLAVFAVVHAYFVLVSPSLNVRNILFSVAMLVVCLQCAWLMLHRVDPKLRVVTRGVGFVFVGFSLVSLARIVLDLIFPVGNDFFRSPASDALLLLTYQLLFILLMFFLLLMVNSRLFRDLENDILARTQAESALRSSEEKFFKAFQSSPDAILISRLRDGLFVEMNDGFFRLTGYAWEDVQGSSSTALELWVDPRDREQVVDALKNREGVRDREYRFRAKSGRILDCLYSGEIIYLGGEAHILSVARDISDRKLAEEVLHRQNEILEALQQTTLDLLSELDLDALLEKIVRRAGLLMGTTAGYLDLVEPETGQLKPRVGLGALVGSLEHPVRRGEGVAGTVWQTGEPLIVENYDTWPGRIGDLGSNEIRSIVGVPLISGNQVIGVLGLAYDAGSEKVFTVQDVDLLTQFARLVAIAIKNARLYHAVQDELAERKRMEAIIRMRLRLWEYATDHSTNELMKIALDETEFLTGSLISFYHFVDADQNGLSLQAWSTRTEAKFCEADGVGKHYPISEAGVWVDCVFQKKPVVHNDYASLPHRKGMPSGHAEVIRELVVPTMRDSKVVSILGVGNKPSDYDSQDVELVSYIADVVWSIVEQKRTEERIRQLNKQLERQAMTDELTGLANRRAFFIRGGDEIRRVRRYQSTFSLLMLDIDEFKNVNDTYGHEAGDLMLQTVARTIEENVRESDFVARLGGEEFAVLLPSTQLQEALVSAERIRAGIDASQSTHRGQSMHVTVSIGVMQYQPEMSDLDDVLRDADAAMYHAKGRGRNRVFSGL
jgi:diguanylate cyclase (GGDEF)-like protein/PAS domain S-box-containing protein